MKIMSDTPYDKMTDLFFAANEPADSQLISQLGFHMESTPEFPGDGFPKAAVHREKSFEQVLHYAAEMGNNEAVLGLADYYLCDGPKRIPNAKAAAEALKIGQQRDFHEASFRLAQMMEQGKLGRHRLKEAINLYREAAVFGDGRSGVRLGWLLYKGQGIKRDKAKALYWFNQSAKNGGTEAYGALCKIHFVGKLVPRDDIETYKWCDLAIATLRGGRMKREALNYMHKLADRMTDADIDKAYAKEEDYAGYNKNG
jgi:TPR repeat protein